MKEIAGKKPVVTSRKHIDPLKDLKTTLREHYAAKRATVLGFEAAGFDLYFLDEISLEALADASILDVGGVHSVDQIHVLGIAGAINLKTTRTI